MEVHASPFPPDGEAMHKAPYGTLNSHQHTAWRRHYCAAGIGPANHAQTLSPTYLAPSLLPAASRSGQQEDVHTYRSHRTRRTTSTSIVRSNASTDACLAAERVDHSAPTYLPICQPACLPTDPAAHPHPQPTRTHVSKQARFTHLGTEQTHATSQHPNPTQRTQPNSSADLGPSSGHAALQVSTYVHTGYRSHEVEGGHGEGGAGRVGR